MIGLTVTGPNQADAIRRALQVSVDGVNPFQVVQATWNLLERSAGNRSGRGEGRGWGVIVKEGSPTAGLPTSRRRTSDALEKEAAAQGTTIDALALAAALSQPWADVVLSGAVTREQLDSNLKSIASRA